MHSFFLLQRNSLFNMIIWIPVFMFTSTLALFSTTHWDKGIGTHFGKKEKLVLSVPHFETNKECVLTLAKKPEWNMYSSPPMSIIGFYC